MINSSEKELTSYHIVLVLLIVVASVYFLYVTNQGLVMTPDSVVYLGAAQSLGQGNGLLVPFGFPPNQPLTQFPPLVPYAIFTLSQSGLSLLNSGMVLNLLLLVAFILVMDRLLTTLLGKKNILTLILLTFVVISLINSFLFTTLGSEPLMIVLGLTGFNWLIISETKGKQHILLVAGLLMALTLASRYAGITYLAASIIVILIFSNGTWRNKIWKVVVLSTPGMLFLAWWFLRDTGMRITATNRLLLIHPIDTAQIGDAIDTISHWFLISTNSQILFKLTATITFILISLFVIFKTYSKQQMDSASLLEKLLVTFILIYPIFLILSITLLDANIPLDYRLLSPIFVLIPCIVVLFIKFLSENKQKLKRPLLLFFFSLFTVFSAVMLLQNRSFIHDVHQFGFGFNYSEFKNNPVFAYLVSREQPAIFVSNAPEPVFLFTRQEVFSFPRRFNDMEDRNNPEFDHQVSMLKKEYLKDSAYFIFFEKIPGGNLDEQRFYQQQFGLSLAEEYQDVVIYTYMPGHKP
ncbi:MAG: hypothetical protein BGO78_13585 [Chloroflexi bacterium 44-23]|nr:MAG: hypothetical protein BGO78_13585 [Chloroflexi bacterium 44-23]